MIALSTFMHETKQLLFNCIPIIFFLIQVGISRYTVVRLFKELNS